MHDYWTQHSGLYLSRESDMGLKIETLDTLALNFTGTN